MLTMYVAPKILQSPAYRYPVTFPRNSAIPIINEPSKTENTLAMVIHVCCFLRTAYSRHIVNIICVFRRVVYKDSSRALWEYIDSKAYKMKLKTTIMKVMDGKPIGNILTKPK